MSLVGTLIGFGLRQVIGTVAGDEAAEMAGKMTSPLIQRLERHFTDHSQALPKALARANDRAWQALSISLAGDGFLDKINVFFASGDDKGIREQVRLFLQDKTIGFEETSEFRQKCLVELSRVKKAALLTAQNLSPNDVVRQMASFQRFANPTGMMDASEQVVRQIADELDPDCPNLAKLLRRRPVGGPPLLVSAFAYFFRREVETNQALAHGLTFDGLRQLSAAQESAFGEVNQALTSLGDQFDQVFEQLDRVETVAVETHGAVLDLQAEFQRISRQHFANADEVRRLMMDVLNRVSQAGMQKGEVKPQHSFSIRSEDECNAVKQLLVRFRQLPAQQKQFPALLNGLGKLQIGSGDFDGARQTFLAVSLETTDASAQAEAYYNAYRAALEEKKWTDALAAVEKAASLDSKRFAPFPLQRYQAKRILGAGGFGTAFLCLDRFFNTEVVVKTLQDAALERKVSDVFREAQILGHLHHPVIISVRDCNYADLTQLTHPYIVMDYFPGGTLESFLQERGTISPEDLILVARQIAQGMRAAHRENILHRDLKPDNILIRKEGSNWKVKIIDFGLGLRKQTIETSMAVPSAGNTVLSDSVAGTLKYAPPEQLRELKGVKPGPYSDVYAFGKLCCYAMFRTTEPKDRHWKAVVESIRMDLKEMLDRCREEELEHRLPSFEPVLKVLDNVEPRRRAEIIRQQAKHRAKPGDVIINGLGMKLAWIPPGAFIMGSPFNEEGRFLNETQHKVTLTKGFYLGIYQVTTEQWQALMGDNPSHFRGEKNLPVEHVSWEDCHRFLTRLSEKEGPAYRLPTEAEWEYACRAGTTTAFYFGDTIHRDQANYQRKKTTPVGRFPPNAWGLYDMHGNVWEWCWDWYDEYLKGEVVDPTGLPSRDFRVSRGGSFINSAERVRCASRYAHRPVDYPSNVGFRVAL